MSDRAGRIDVLATLMNENRSEIRLNFLFFDSGADAGKRK